MEEKVGTYLISSRKMLQYMLIIAILYLSVIFVFAETTEPTADEKEVPYAGVPVVTLNLSNIDNSGNLIYCGIDVGVFWDPEEDGTFVIYPDDAKIKRILKRNTSFTIDLGSVSSFQKGKLYKLAMRTLYVPTGAKQEPIIIAAYSNGKEGWIPIPGSLFRPSYFINTADTPYIQHTQKWDDNRSDYNITRVQIGQTESVRSDSIFWSGEKFMLHVETAEVVAAVKVSITGEEDAQGNPYTVRLTEHTAHDVVSGGAIYEGELWDDSMLNKWGNYIPKALTFKLEILGVDGEILEEKIVEVIVDNRELYYRNRKEY